MLRPPLSSTLFPYTTLFRSRAGRRAREEVRMAARIRRVQRAAGGLRAQDRRARRAALMDAKKLVKMANDIAAFLDRKSTRLNSSHLGISYAVFCLKKKKKYI